jgi:hypothetical protein
VFYEKSTASGLLKTRRFNSNNERKEINNVGSFSTYP